MYILITKYIERDLIIKYLNNIFINKPILILNLATKPFIISKLIKVNISYYFLKSIRFNFKLNTKKTTLTNLNSNISLNKFINTLNFSTSMLGIGTNLFKFNCFTHLNSFKLNNLINFNCDNIFNYQLILFDNKDKISLKINQKSILYSKLNFYDIINN